MQIFRSLCSFALVQMTIRVIAGAETGPGLEGSEVAEPDIVRFDVLTPINSSSGLVKSCWEFQQ